MPLYNKAFWLAKNSDGTCNNQSEYFISEYLNVDALKFVYDAGSWK